MAEVWAGTNQRTGKRIALKVILRSFASSRDAVELFRREALAASRVNHPNVVNVFDVIDHEGMTCIVMEMLEGEPFGSYLGRKGFLGVDEAVALLLPAMRGVAAANAEGVIHRDLKPQNIFICIGPDGRLITTKVLDFGISVMMEKSVDAAQATQLLATHGTPAYMSPEHISGAPDIDERADVYGFGVLFFEALTGQLPFLGDPGPALLVRIINEPAPKITIFRPDLPPRMVEIVERAMAKDAKDRFARLDDFIHAVEEDFLPPSPLPRALTPMAGVPLFAQGDAPSGVADSVVQLLHRSEPSGLHEINETKALFTLPRETDSGAGEPSRRLEAIGRTGEVPQVTTKEVNLRPSVGRNLRRVLAKRGMAAMMFVGVVVVVGWLAFPTPVQYRARDEEPVIRVPQVPVAVPQAAVPVKPVEAAPPVPSQAIADEAPAVDLSPKGRPDRTTHALLKATPKKKKKAIRSVVSPRTLPLGVPVARPEEVRAQTPASSAPLTDTRTQTQPSIPRAGALTPADF